MGRWFAISPRTNALRCSRNQWCGEPPEPEEAAGAEPPEWDCAGGVPPETGCEAAAPPPVGAPPPDVRAAGMLPLVPGGGPVGLVANPEAGRGDIGCMPESLDIEAEGAFTKL